jgi:hypothetical protein
LFRLAALLPCNKRGPFYHSQEEELRASNDPKFSHLNDDLHVEVTAFAPPAEAHARIAYALAEIRRFLVPVSTLFFNLLFSPSKASLFAKVPLVYWTVDKIFS